VKEVLPRVRHCGGDGKVAATMTFCEEGTKCDSILPAWSSISRTCCALAIRKKG
jgi:hypothetical protein